MPLQRFLDAFEWYNKILRKFRKTFYIVDVTKYNNVEKVIMFFA